jgi:hypothetical protein
LRFDAAFLGETIPEISYKARRNATANAEPSLPGPTIAMLGFAAIAGSISGVLASTKSLDQGFCNEAQLMS